MHRSLMFQCTVLIYQMGVLEKYPQTFTQQLHDLHLAPHLVTMLGNETSLENQSRHVKYFRETGTSKTNIIIDHQQVVATINPQQAITSHYHLPLIINHHCSVLSLSMHHLDGFQHSPLIINHWECTIGLSPS